MSLRDECRQDGPGLATARNSQGRHGAALTSVTAADTIAAAGCRVVYALARNDTVTQGI
jgi:hypothetical protein